MCQLVGGRERGGGHYHYQQLQSYNVYVCVCEVESVMKKSPKQSLTQSSF